MVAAVDLQASSQDLAEAENMATSTLEVVLEDQEAVNELSSSLREKACADLKKIFDQLKTKLLEHTFENNADRISFRKEFNRTVRLLEKNDLARAENTFNTNVKPVIEAKATTKQQKAVATVTLAIAKAKFILCDTNNSTGLEDALAAVKEAFANLKWHARQELGDSVFPELKREVNLTSKTIEKIIAAEKAGDTANEKPAEETKEETKEESESETETETEEESSSGSGGC